jgi:hypothetical protein
MTFNLYSKLNTYLKKSKSDDFGLLYIKPFTNLKYIKHAGDLNEIHRRIRCTYYPMAKQWN